jgi:uncharacterized NAD(P)/FAD-binding protein YdhS
VHLLNVRADGMSALAGDPDHFVRAFEAEGGNRRGFAQRRLFGRYLSKVLQEAIAIGFTETVEATAVAAHRDDGGWHVTVDNGSSIDVDALVLALGNQEPEALRAFDGAGRRFVRNPWGTESHAAVQDLAASGDTALLVGTGLTMVDLVL